MMEALMSLIYPEYRKTSPDERSMKYETSRIRNCEEDSMAWLSFSDQMYIDAVRECFENDYYGALKRSDEFIRAYLRTSEDLIMKRAFRAILETIVNDTSIPEEAEFTILPNRGKVAKKDLLTRTEYSYQSFLLGIWYYILTSEIKNADGKDTIHAWFAFKGKNKEREFKSEIGKGKEVSDVAFILLSSGDDQFVVKTAQEEELLSKTTDYSPYISKLDEKYSNVFTILYEQAQPFRKIFVCSDLIYYQQEATGFIYNSDYVEGLDGEDPYNGRPITLQNETAKSLLGKLGNRLIVGGTGGLGKSMMMRHFLLDACENYSKYGFIPFFLSVREYNEERDLVDFVYFQTLSLHGMTKEEFKRILMSGKALLLFDGMDEIVSNRQRHFESAIESFTDRYSGNMFIISTRRFKKFDALSNFKFLHLSPLTKPQALELVKKLKFREDIKKPFLEKLDKTFYDEHRDFVNNPLLLTIFLMTFQAHPDVPSKMHLFYSEAYNALAYRHDGNKGGFVREFKTKLDPDRFREYLTRFCAFSYGREMYSFTKEEYYEVFEEAKTGFEEESERFSATDFLDDMISTVCIFYEEGQKYHFVHRSFQEYFTACFLRRKDDELYYPDIANFFDSDRETLYGDMTFAMFYEMETHKVEDHLFLPYLRNLLGGEEEKGERGFFVYLLNAHPVLRHCVGRSCAVTEDDEGETETKPFILRFIKRLRGLEETPNLDGIPKVDAFIVRRYTEFEGLLGLPFKVVCPLEEAKQLAAAKKINPDELEEVGWDLSIDVSQLIKEKEKYPDIYNFVLREEGDLFQEYSGILDYYLALKNRKANKPIGAKRIFC